jgi:hypothetical protein
MMVASGLVTGNRSVRPAAMTPPAASAAKMTPLKAREPVSCWAMRGVQIKTAAWPAKAIVVMRIVRRRGKPSDDGGSAVPEVAQQ